MKKILIATTALVGTASVAAAEVTFGGYGRFGLAYNENPAGVTTNETTVEQRFRLTITGVAETDGGVKLEGRVRIETNEQADNSLPGDGGVGAAGFAASTGGFRVDVGNVSDVIDSGDTVVYFKDYGLRGAVGQQNAHALPLTGFSGNAADTTTLKVLYEVGSLALAASYSDDKAGDGDAGQTADRENWQVGIGYTFGDFNAGVAVGSETSNVIGGVDNDFWAVSFGGDIGAISFNLLVTDADSYDTVVNGVAGDIAVGGYLAYELSAATTIYASFSDGGPATNTDTAFGLGVKQDLGGDVSIRGAVAQGTTGLTTADLGVWFEF